MNALIGRNSIVARLTQGAAVLVTGICFGLGVTPAPAQLIHAELSGPITAIFGDSTLLGSDVTLGTPMRLSFTYGPNLPPESTDTYESGAIYVGTGGDVLGSLAVGDFAFEIPRVRLAIFSDLGYSSADYPHGLLGDVIYLYSTDTPTGAYHVQMSAILLYPTGTFTSYAPAAPAPDFVFAQLSITRSEAWGNVSVSSTGIFGDLDEFRPVPESTTMTGLAALALVAIVTQRIRARCTTALARCP